MGGMSYHVKNADGEARQGDPILDHLLIAEADALGGYITDDEGVVVYESPAYLEARAEAEA